MDVIFLRRDLLKLDPHSVRDVYFEDVAFLGTMSPFAFLEWSSPRLSRDQSVVSKEVLDGYPFGCKDQIKDLDLPCLSSLPPNLSRKKRERFETGVDIRFDNCSK